MPESGSGPGPRASWLNRTVLGAGITSALGDFSYETTNAILPGFLATLGLPAVVLGTIEGAADAVSSFTKLGAGYVADRLGHRKTLVVGGYALTAVMQVFLALAAGWPLILIGRVVGWFGRGVRGPLRDAILAETITPAARGRAFGFHRAADTLGAVVGPLLGVALLDWARRRGGADPANAFRLVFWLAVIPGIGSVMSFAFLVEDERRAGNPTLRFWTAIRALPADFRRYLVGVGAFGVGDFSPALLILAATELLAPRFGTVRAAEIGGLLYVGRNLVQMLASLPLGALADRFGHRRILAVGYALGATTAGLLTLAFAQRSESLPMLVLIFGLAGLYIAAEEALEPSLAADYVGPEIRTIGYGVLGSVNGVGDFVSSALVGALWTLTSPVVGFGTAALTMAAGATVMAKWRGK